METNITKQQALDKIKELEQYIKDQDKPKVGAYGVTGTALLKDYTFAPDETCILFRGGSGDAYTAARNVWAELCMCEGAGSDYDGGSWQSCIHYRPDGGFYVDSWRSVHAPFTVFFKTDEQCRAAINKLGKDKLNTLFMIDE